MSRFVLSFFCFLFNISLYANITGGVHDISIYREALEYIMSDLKTPKIFISPYFEYIDSWYIPLDSLNDVPGKKQIIEKIMKRDEYRVVTGYSCEDEGKYSDELASLTASTKKPIYMLFFSKFKDGICFVSVVPKPFYIRKIKKNKIYRHIDVIGFNESINYLFIYDCDGKVLKVLKTHLEYD